MRPSPLILLPLLSLAACSGAADPPPVTPPGPAAEHPPAAPPGAPSAPGEMVVIEVSPARGGLQHPMAADFFTGGKPHAYMTYQGHELVVYVAKKIDCPDKTRLTGKWT